MSSSCTTGVTTAGTNTYAFVKSNNGGYWWNERANGGGPWSSSWTSLGGKLPVNPSGGLKAKGHPIGATGAAQIAEIVTQLRGEAGLRQVEGARTGLTHTLGGNTATVLVSLFGRG